MISHPIIAFLVLPLAAYLIAATPFGVIIARAKGVDLRKSGSGNVGATNVGRVLGRKWGYLCFALDVLKGLLPVLTAGWLLGSELTLAKQLAWLLVAMAAVLGHVLPFWLGFRGGKGVATSLGVVLGIYPYFTLAGAIALAVWVAVTLISRYVSLGSIVAVAVFVPAVIVINLLMGNSVAAIWPLISFAGLVALLVILRHISNIRRLLAGTENKIRSRASSGEHSA